MAQREREFKRLTDRLQSLSTAYQLQRMLGSEEQRKNERRFADATGKKMKNFGFRDVRVRFLGGVEVTLRVRYYARSQARVEKGKGTYFGLMLLAIYVVDEQGKIEREFTPVLDGTLKGPDAVFRLIEFYLSELHIEAATKVLFIADGAR